MYACILLREGKLRIYLSCQRKILIKSPFNRGIERSERKETRKRLKSRKKNLGGKWKKSTRL